MERRVVITGMSAITPIGHGKDQIVKSLLNGISGIKPLREEEFLSPLYSFQGLRDGRLSR